MLTSEEKLILEKLQDEESKFIFEKRIQFRNTGDVKYIDEIVRRCLPDYRGYILEKSDLKFKQFVDENKNSSIAIFGAGRRGKKLYDDLQNAGIKVDTVIDNNAKGHFNGTDIEIVSPDQADYDGKKVVITPYSGYDDMFDQLVKIGRVAPEMIYKPLDYDVLFYCLDEKQYFDEDIIILQQEEVFVDGGVFNLGTSRIFFDKCKRLGVSDFKIFGFEPNKTNYNICLESLEKENEYLGKYMKLMNYGLWDREEKVYFAQSGELDSRSRITQDETGSCIHAVALDEVLDEKVTFVKMDIEGAELEALMGASRIIKRDKPKLAICVYHKPEDLTKIPLYISELVPEYKFYLRHYSNCQCETVLYAVV